MSVKRRAEDTRGMALWYITEYLETRLGIPRNAFINGLSVEDGVVKNAGKKREEKPGISEKTLQRYIRGETPMKGWTFKQFWGLVEETCQNYMDKNKLNDAAEIWEREKAKQKEMCRSFFIDLSAPERSGGFQEYAQNKRDILSKIEPIFKTLDKKTQYSLQCNFLALANVTAEDCVFLAHIMTRTEEEKEELKAAMLQGDTVDAGTMLVYLQSEEMRCWVNLKNQDYTNSARNKEGYWKGFSNKLMTLTSWQFAHVSLLIETLLLLALDNWDPGTNGIEDKLPTAEDIELLLLFKYCLAPDERGQYIESE